MRFFCAYGTNIKILIPCTSYIYSVSKTKEGIIVRALWAR